MNPFKAARVALGATQQEVADATGVARSTIASLETGKRNGQIEVVQRLAAHYGVPVDALLRSEIEQLEQESSGRARTPATDPLSDILDLLRALRERPGLEHLVRQLAHHDDPVTVRRIIKAVNALLDEE